MASILDILKKYRKLIPFYLSVQKIDLWILEKFLKNYKPRKKTFVMAVGGMYGERELLKIYHEKNFNVKDVKIAACNILPIYFMNSANYDFRITGKKGDASKEFMWQLANQELGTKKYDLVYIRFPDLFKVNNWENVLELSLKYLTKDGRIFMMMRKVDLRKLDRFLNSVEYKPVLKKKTGVTFFGRQSSIYHTVVVFRN